jgi:hypothetical protein
LSDPSSEGCPGNYETEFTDILADCAEGSFTDEAPGRQRSVDFCGDTRSDIVREKSTGIREETKQETKQETPPEHSNYRVLDRDQYPVGRWGETHQKAR